MSRLITEDEVETFWREGVVVLRDALAPDVVDSMAAPVERALLAPETTDMTSMRDALADGGMAVLDEDAAVTGAFLSGLDHWIVDADFRRFAVESPLPQLVRSLLRTTKLHLYEDSVLVKEPGAALPTAMHNDASYFHLTGSQIATTWVPLDVVDADSGAVTYVAGSHTWNREFRPNYFVSDEPIAGTTGQPVGDLDGYELLSFDTVPGDVIVHHARTVHGASGNVSARRRRAISIRYCGDDARFEPRPGVPAKPHHQSYRPGDPLAEPAFPCAWDRP